jgi:hypothetical protein
VGHLATRSSNNEPSDLPKYAPGGCERLRRDENHPTNEPQARVCDRCEHRPEVFGQPLRHLRRCASAGRRDTHTNARGCAFATRTTSSNACPLQYIASPTDATIRFGATPSMGPPRAQSMPSSVRVADKCIAL